MNTMKSRFILIALFLLSITCIFGIDLIPSEYKVKIGDVFSIQSSLIDSASAQIPVLASGNISLHPLEVEVHVQGETLENAIKLIKEAFHSETQVSHILVDLFSIAPSRITLNGAVVYSGSYIFENIMTLYDISKLPRGMMPSASRKIKITRDGITRTYDLRKFIRNGDVSNNPVVYDGDILTYEFAKDFAKVHVYSDTSCVIEYIELDETYTVGGLRTTLEEKYRFTDFDNASMIRKGSALKVKPGVQLQVGDNVYFGTLLDYVYVTGQVARPERFPFESGKNARYYISRAGGNTLYGSKKKIYILKNDGTKENYKGQEILPGDTIFVPETWVHSIRQYLYALVSCATLYNVFIK